jgi:hypothetical protein
MLSGGASLAALITLAMVPRLVGLRRRYDQAALRPIPTPLPPQAAGVAVPGDLLAWAREGCGDGRVSMPWAEAQPPCPLAWRTVDATARNSLLPLGYTLAGYPELDRRSPAQGKLYRLKVQLWPLLWFARQEGLPWDDGWLDAGQLDTARLEALARWRPRRATLIVLDGLNAAQAGAVHQTLEAQAPHYRQPVRVLECGTGR